MNYETAPGDLNERTGGFLQSSLYQKFTVFLFPNQKSAISAATSPNSTAKARMNLVLLGCEYIGYVNKLIRTDLVNKTSGIESSPVLSNM